MIAGHCQALSKTGVFMSATGVFSRLVRNAATAMRHPSMFAEYAAYQWSRAVHGGSAVRSFPRGVRISGFTGFSEYHTCAAAISHSEELFLDTYPFPPGDMLDIGANLGIFSAGLCKRFPSRRVFAFEPNGSTYAALVRNLALSNCRMVTPHHLAVADYDGEICFAADDASRATSRIAAEPVAGVTTIACCTVDSFIEKNGIQEVALMKVDVEGFEAKVFAGARHSLVAGRIKVIYFEICPAMAVSAGFNPEDASRALVQAGYDLFDIGCDGALRPVKSSAAAGVVYGNWVAVTRRSPSTG